MPILGTIEWDTKKDTFLKDSEISDLVSSMDEKGLNEIEENLSTPITNERKTGLSLEALNIDGRAPLNELSYELLTKIRGSIATMEALKRIARGEGNKHRQDEANEYYEKVIEEYRKRYEKAKELVQKYNFDRKYYVEKEEKDENGTPQKVKKQKQYDECHIDFSPDNPVNLKGNLDADPNDIDPGKEAHDAKVNEIQEAVEKANEFYEDYVVPAKGLKEECAGLDIFTLPSEIQQNASSEHYLNSNGFSRDIYTNPDGSKVQIDYDAEGNIKSKRVIDASGNVTETTKYDKDGNIIENNVFKSTNNSTDGAFYNYEDEFITSLNNKEDITLPPGYELDYDAPTIGYIPAGTQTNNVQIKSTKDNPITLKYNSKTGKYDVYDKNGKTSNFSLDPKILAGGTNVGGSTFGNDTSLYYDSNGDGTADKIANSYAQKSQSSIKSQTSSQAESTTYSYEDEFRNSIINKENIELPSGYRLDYDAPTIGLIPPGTQTNNVQIKSTKDNPITLKYNSTTRKYDVYDKNGKTSNFSLDPKVLAGGSNAGGSTSGNDTSLYYDSNGDGTADKIATNNPTNNKTSNSSASIYGTTSPTSYNYESNHNPQVTTPTSNNNVETSTMSNDTSKWNYDIDGDGIIDTNKIEEGQKVYGIDTDGDGITDRNGGDN